jgi:hypothetical protein
MTIAQRLAGLALLGLLLVGVTDAAPALALGCDQAACVTHHDTIPNFAGRPTIRSARSGAWSDPGTSTPGRSRELPTSWRSRPERR